jgi:hypothetical protein
MTQFSISQLAPIWKLPENSINLMQQLTKKQKSKGKTVVES